MKKMTALFLLVLVVALVWTSHSLAMPNRLERGTIRGSVYVDVNGDGRCVNSGVTGEIPMPNIDLTFLSEDQGQSVRLYSGGNGTYGLPSAGQGSWVVTAVPNPSLWQVTSTNPLRVEVSEATGLVQLNVDFCIKPAPGVALSTARQATLSQSRVPALVQSAPVENSSAPVSNSVASEQLLTSPPEPQPAENLEERAAEEVNAVPEENWLTYLNLFRSMGGMTPFQNSEALSYGSQLHGRYMVLNDKPTAHTENSNNPLYSAERNQAAQNGNIFATTQLEADYRWAINFWISAPFHLVNIIDPTLETVGYGDFHGDNGTFKMAGVLDVLSEKGNGTSDVTYPIYFPAPDSSTWIVRHSLYEWPDPLTSCPGYQRPAGAPIVLQLGDGSGTPRVTSFSVAVDGQVVESCLISETSYTNPDSFAQRTGRAILDDQDAIVILPRRSLQGNSTYTVNVVANGQAYTWSFSTTNSPPAN